MQAEQIWEKLELAVRESSPGKQTAVLFSGGLDSTVLAVMLSQHTPVKLYTVGRRGSHDMEIGRKTAISLDLPWEGLYLEHDQIIEGLSELTSLIHVENPVVLSYELPLHLAAGRIHETHLFSGQGADELFGGYAKYVDLDIDERREKMAEDLENVLEEGMLLEKTIADYHDKVIHYPFLDPKMRDAVDELSMEDKIQGEERKLMLREVARMMGLKEVATRKKKAAQYGTGIMKSMKKEAKRRDTDVRGLVEQLSSERN